MGRCSVQHEVVIGNFGGVKLTYGRPGNTFCTFPSVGSAKVADRRFYRGLLCTGGITIMPNATFNSYNRNFVHTSCYCSIRRVGRTVGHVNRFLSRVG